MTDPDIPQGRAWTEPEPPVHRTKAEQELYVSPDLRSDLSSFLPPPSLYPRVVLRFAPEKDLWISGMLAGGSELAEAPAIVDRKSTRLNSSHSQISYAVFCLKKK